MRPLADIAMALMGPRGSGRTYKMLQAAPRDATVLCGSHYHMRALEGMAADMGRTDLRFVVPEGGNLKGREGPVVADHYAIERFLLEADAEIAKLRAQVVELGGFNGGIPPEA